MDILLNDNLDSLQVAINYNFISNELLTEALTHKSYKNNQHNERLEFLGDSVVNLIIGKYVFSKFENYPEGKLSKLRASLVNEESLTKIAKSISLGDYIFLSRGEEKNNGRNKPSILSDTLEAVIGAIFLESGLDKTYIIMMSLVENVYEDIKLEGLYKDYKTLLQELTQSRVGDTPEYKVTQENGPEHDKIFTVCVHIDGKAIATSTGKSKKIAQQSCAKEALEILANE